MSPTGVVRPYGDTTGDGRVQVSFTLPVPFGDEAERARKTVSARVRDALSKIGPVHPELAAHLRGSLRLGTRCSYSPPAGVTWKVN